MVYYLLHAESQCRGVEQLVARRAHNPEVVGSSPSPATSKKPPNSGGFCVTYRLKFNTEMAQNLQADVYLMFIGMLDSLGSFEIVKSYRAENHPSQKSPLAARIVCGNLKLSVIVRSKSYGF